MVAQRCRRGEGAGKLVRMAEGQAVTYKLTKKLDDIVAIEQLPSWLRRIDTERNQVS